MTLPVQISYPAASTTAICIAQTTSGAGALIINGSLLDLAYTSNAGGLRRVVLPKIQRAVTLTSTTNLSARTITITGFDLTLTAVTATITAPNNTTVTTTERFHIITGVSSDGALATNLSVGTAAAGETYWRMFDTWIASPQQSVNVQLVSGTAEYTVQSTFDDVAVDATEANIQKISNPLGTLQTVSGVYTYTQPIRACRVLFTANNTGAEKVTFMQSGGRV